MARSCMAASLLASLLLLCLLSQVGVTRGATATQLYQARHLLSIDCNRACEFRCSKASRKKICMPDCKVCCKSCNCVPSGTAGNREECACYATLKNDKGTGKCP